MAQIEFDAVYMTKVYNAFIARLNLEQPYFLGVLPREQVVSTLVEKDVMGGKYVRVPNMMSGLVDVMPSVAHGQNPVKLDSVKFDVDKVKFDHFFIQTDLGVQDFEEAHHQLNAILSGETPHRTARDVSVMLYGNDFKRARIAYNNKLTLFWYQLISNGEFEVLRDIHNDPYFYKVKGYETLTMKKSDFLANPVAALLKLRDFVISNGGEVTSINLGSEIATEFLTTEWLKKQMQFLKVSGFNYEPVQAINPNNQTIAAKGIYDITMLGDIPVRQVSTKIKVGDVVRDAFDPNAIVAMAERKVGKLYTTPTLRNFGNGNFQYDSSDMSYYKHKESDMHVSHRSAGFFLPAVTHPQNIGKLILTDDD